MIKIDWTQRLTIILTIIGSMLAVWYTFYHIIREDIKRHDIELGEMRQEFKSVRQEMKEEFSEVHTLWADLLKQIYEIKLDQSKKA